MHVWTTARGEAASIGLRQPGKTVAADEKDVFDASVLKLGQDAEPESRALGLRKPEAQDVALALRRDAERHVDRLLLHRRSLADAHEERVEISR